MQPGKRVKGKLLMAARKALKADLTPTQLANIQGRLSPGAAWFFDERFVANAWYDQPSLEELHEATAEEVSMDPEAFALHLGERTVDVTMGTAMQTFLGMFGTPRRIRSSVAAMTSTLYDSGDITTEMHGGVVSIFRRDWAGHTRVQCLNMLGSMVGLCKRARGNFAGGERTQCVSDGHACCVYELRFTGAL